MKQILFLAHELEKLVPVGRAHRTLNVEDEEVERYEDVRKMLSLFGRVMREKTSGTFRRISTPPNGIPVPVPEVRHRVLIENPSDHASTVEVLEEQRRDVIRIRDAFLNAINDCDVVVAMIELESDTRGSLIEHAVAKHKPVLCLRRAGIKAPLQPMYLYRPGIKCWTYGRPEELYAGLKGFFGDDPLARSQAG